MSPQTTGFSQIHSRSLGSDGGGQAMSVLLSWHEKVRMNTMIISVSQIEGYWHIHRSGRRNRRSGKHSTSDDRQTHSLRASVLEDFSLTPRVVRNLAQGYSFSALHLGQSMNLASLYDIRRGERSRAGLHSSKHFRKLLIPWQYRTACPQMNFLHFQPNELVIRQTLVEQPVSSQRPAI